MALLRSLQAFSKQRRTSVGNGCAVYLARKNFKKKIFLKAESAKRGIVLRNKVSFKSVLKNIYFLNLVSPHVYQCGRGGASQRSSL